MKKILVTLLVLALVAPAFAVSFTSADLTGGKMRISYNVPTGEVLRGVALKLSTTAGTATIAGTGDVTAINSFFDVFIDYAFSVPAGFTVTPRVGHPLADSAAAGQLTAFPASAFSLSMGVLDETGNQGGVTGSGVLCEIQYTGTGTADIKVEADTLRGGAVVGDGVAVGTPIVQPATFTQTLVFLVEAITTPSVAKTTAAPAIAGRVNSGRSETFVASGAVSNMGHLVEYQFTWGDTTVGPWGAASQNHTYTYAAAATYNVTVQARCIADPAILSAASAPVALTTEEISSSATALYATWATFSRRPCWALPKNCRGDADGRQQGSALTGFWNVGTNDLNILKNMWQLPEPTKGVGINARSYDPDGAGVVPAIWGICADFARDQQGSALTGFWRVGTNDLNNCLKVYWQKAEPTKGAGIAVCPLGGTGGIIYYTAP